VLHGVSKRKVFTARYGLIPYINQITFIPRLPSRLNESRSALISRELGLAWLGFVFKRLTGLTTNRLAHVNITAHANFL